MAAAAAMDPGARFSSGWRPVVELPGARQVISPPPTVSTIIGFHRCGRSLVARRSPPLEYFPADEKPTDDPPSR